MEKSSIAERNVKKNIANFCTKQVFCLLRFSHTGQGGSAVTGKVGDLPCPGAPYKVFYLIRDYIPLSLFTLFTLFTQETLPATTSRQKKLQAKHKKLSQVCRRFGMMSESLWPDYLNSVFGVLSS